MYRCKYDCSSGINLSVAAMYEKNIRQKNILLQTSTCARFATWVGLTSHGRNFTKMATTFFVNEYIRYSRYFFLKNKNMGNFP